MRTTHLSTVSASITSHQMSAPGGSQVNKVKLVSGLGHQMSLAGVSIQRGLGPWQGGSLCRGAMAGGRSLYSEVHYEVMVTWDSICEQSDPGTFVLRSTARIRSNMPLETLKDLINLQAMRHDSTLIQLSEKVHYFTN